LSEKTWGVGLKNLKKDYEKRKILGVYIGTGVRKDKEGRDRMRFEEGWKLACPQE